MTTETRLLEIIVYFEDKRFNRRIKEVKERIYNRLTNSSKSEQKLHRQLFASVYSTFPEISELSFNHTSHITQQNRKRLDIKFDFEDFYKKNNIALRDLSRIDIYSIFLIKGEESCLKRKYSEITDCVSQIIFGFIKSICLEMGIKEATLTVRMKYNKNVVLPQPQSEDELLYYSANLRGFVSVRKNQLKLDFWEFARNEQFGAESLFKQLQIQIPALQVEFKNMDVVYLNEDEVKSLLSCMKVTSVEEFEKCFFNAVELKRRRIVFLE